MQLLAIDVRQTAKSIKSTHSGVKVYFPFLYTDV